MERFCSIFSIRSVWSRNFTVRLIVLPRNQVKFKTNSLVEQAQYYSNKYNETSAFNQNSFDNSPANRIINTKLPGTLWAAGTGKSVLYDLNDAADDVQKWKIGYNSGEQPINIGAYAPNELFKTRYTDEQG